MMRKRRRATVWRRFPSSGSEKSRAGWIKLHQGIEAAPHSQSEQLDLRHVTRQEVFPSARSLQVDSESDVIKVFRCNSSGSSFKGEISPAALSFSPEPEWRGLSFPDRCRHRASVWYLLKVWSITTSFNISESDSDQSGFSLLLSYSCCFSF